LGLVYFAVGLQTFQREQGTTIAGFGLVCGYHRYSQKPAAHFGPLRVFRPASTGLDTPGLAGAECDQFFIACAFDFAEPFQYRL
jgi:hypothetical protein